MFFFLFSLWELFFSLSKNHPSTESVKQTCGRGGENHGHGGRRLHRLGAVTVVAVASVAELERFDLVVDSLHAPAQVRLVVHASPGHPDPVLAA